MIVAPVKLLFLLPRYQCRAYLFVLCEQIANLSKRDEGKCQNDHRAANGFFVIVVKKAPMFSTQRTCQKSRLSFETTV